VPHASLSRTLTNALHARAQEKSAVMHIDVIATDIAIQLQKQYPDEASFLTEDDIKHHVSRHVVTPVASITRITRDLLDMCETLRPCTQTLKNARARKRRRGGDVPEDTLDPSDSASNVGSASQAVGGEADESVTMYLRTVNHVMQIYRLHSRLLQAPMSSQA